MTRRQGTRNDSTALTIDDDVRAVDALLRRLHGDARFRGFSDPVGELVRTILSQSTTNANSSRAFDGLVRCFPTWDALAQASVGQITRAIRSGGLARQKAPRIRAIIRQIIDEHGSATLDFLDQMSVEQATEYLLQFDGVGPKTAACVLLFSLGKPVFPVDTHVRRIAERLGWVPPGVSDARIHEMLGQLVPAKMRYRLHINMVTHGRRVCRAKRPDCPACPLTALCDYGREQEGAG